MNIGGAEDYFNSNLDKTGEGVILDITEEQEKDLAEHLETYQQGKYFWNGGYHLFKKNCTHIISSWINKNFDKKIKSIIPSPVKKEIVDNGLGKQTISHPSKDSSEESKIGWNTFRNRRLVILYYQDIEEVVEYVEYKDELVNGVLIIVVEKKTKRVVKGRVPVWGFVDFYPVPGGKEPIDSVQAHLLMSMLRKIIKQDESEQPPVLKDENAEPNGVIMFYKNPYYVNKDPMKSIFFDGNDGSGRPMILRNPFAPKDGVIWSNTYEKWQYRGFFQPEVDPWE